MLEVYTDGCCKGNPGPGGWAFVVYENGQKKGHKKGNQKQTTNNGMELLAILEALRWAEKHNISIDVLHSDSSYAINAITKWMDGWSKKGWTASTGKPVGNLDTMKEIFSLRHRVKSYLHVKGHNGNPGNEMADVLANEAFLAIAW